MPPDGNAPFLPSVLLSSALLVACRAPSGDLPVETVQIAAAADLSLAFQELGGLFEARTQHKANFSFGSSGLLSKQLEHGAPFDLFASASSEFVERAIQAGACDAKTKARYAQGRLAIWGRHAPGSPVLHSLQELAAPHFKRIAIAHPEHAPYGAAAREALRRAGVWQAVEPRLVYAENVRQALQLAETGNVEVAIVASSLLVGFPAGEITPVEGNLYPPLEQTLVVCQRGKSAGGARAFAQLVTSKEGQALLKRHGFGPASAP